MPPRKPTPRTKAPTSRTSPANPKSKAKPKSKSTALRITVRGPLLSKFLSAAKASKLTPEEYGELLIGNSVSPVQLTSHAKRHAAVTDLAKLIASLPGVNTHVASSGPDEWFWWVKFTIDTRHELAWHVVQLLGFVFNYYALESRFLTQFAPVSPPPYLNGGPHEYLSWVIEATAPFYDPRPVTEALRMELPEDLASAEQWREFDNDSPEHPPVPSPQSPIPESYWDLIGPAFDAVSIYDGPEVYDEQVAAYSEPIRHLLAAHWCQSEVCNGGFWQFFYNSTGVLAPDAHDGFRAIGVPELADILKEAMSRLPTPYPRDHEERITAIGERPNRTVNFRDLDDRFYAALGEASPNRFQSAADTYAAKHRSAEQTDDGR